MLLRREDLHASVSDPEASSMNFLNEIANRYPNAISLAAGRPYEGFFSAQDIPHFFTRYLSYLETRKFSPTRMLMQYGRTNGIISDLIAQMLAKDEDIRVPNEAVAVTAGCQEAMVIAVRGLCAGPDDVLLAAEPCYVGITGAARVLGVPVVPVPEAEGPAGLTRAVRETRAAGKNPKALYLVPDFANPSGACLSVEDRYRLLEIAAEEGILLLEDDPYGLFGLDERPRPRLKAIDTTKNVVYLGSFAKSAFPGARVGFLVADQEVVDASGNRTLLADELSAIKSMVTVNTSPVSQAVIGGFLLEYGCSLRLANAERAGFYRENLHTMMKALEQYMPSGTAWNQPAGGFFATVDVPVVADVPLLERSAADYGVLWTPMSFFFTKGAGRHSIRLSCSYLDPADVVEGVRRLAALLNDEIQKSDA
jgi:(S)-3,5-dihydroxyphenylglycine transaminase